MEKIKGEQKTVIEHENGNILVSASAGSGKTFVMISRLRRLILERKANVKDILCMTFTESAAADMKEKLFKSIVEAINEGRTELCEQLTDIPYSSICTIDSFCKKLVKTYFFKAGVSPDFSIADETVSSKLKTDAIDKTFKWFYESEDPYFLTLAERYASSRKDDKFKGIIQSVYDFISTEPNPEEVFNRSLMRYTEQGFNELLKEYKERTDKKLNGIKTKLEDIKANAQVMEMKTACEFVSGLIDDVNGLLIEKDVYGLKRDSSFKRRLSFGKSLSEEGNGLKTLASSVKAEIDKIVENANEYLIDYEKDKESLSDLYKHTEYLQKIVEKYTEFYNAEKKEENVLDFADIERYALNVLTDKEVCEDVKERYKYIFIDEYQDVNGIQESIINKIEKDNLFMVGDVKQSIYGFRGCRPEFFEKKFCEMEKQGKGAYRLNYNFRSAENVVNAVNQVFDFSMTKEYSGINYKNDARLKYGELYEKPYDGRVGLYEYVPEKQKKEVGELELYDILSNLNEEDDNEITSTAMLVSKLISEELGKEYYDLKEKTVKKIEYKDIAVLSRDKTTSYVNKLVSGLIKHGVPVSTETTESVLDYPEIKALIGVLKAIEFRFDDISLATAMKTVGEITDEDLALIATAYYKTLDGKDKRKAHFYDAVNFLLKAEEKDLDEYYKSVKLKLGKFYDNLNKWRDLADFLSAREILEKVIDDNNLYAFLYASPTGTQKVKRVKFFVSRAYNNGKKYTVREFLTLTEKNKKAFNITNGGSENAVKVTTIHSSKGLEFPSVIVCGLEKAFRNKDVEGDIFFDRDCGFAIKGYDDNLRTIFDTPFSVFIKDRIKENIGLEEQRLFYVALTRAKYSLKMAYTGKDSRSPYYNGASRYLEFIPISFDKHVFTEDDMNLLNKKIEPRKVMFSKIDQKAVDKMKENFKFVYPFNEEVGLPLKSSVTASLKKETEYKMHESFNFGDDLTGKERGVIAHKFLEYYDFINKPKVIDFANQLKEQNLMTEKDLESIDLSKLQAVIDGGAFDKVLGKEIYREKSFILNIPANMLFDTSSTAKVVIQGVIDLLIVDNDSAQIVDYKYSALPKDKLKERYSKQLDIYAYAVEKALNIKVKGKYLISLLTGETIEIN